MIQDSGVSFVLWFFVRHLLKGYFLTDDSDRVTIKEACSLVGCSRKTIYRWLERGLLVREKAGANAYVSLCAVRSLYASVSSGAPGMSADLRVSPSQGSDVSDVFHVSPPPLSSFTVERTHYEGLLVRLGQLEAEKKYLLEYQSSLAATSKELAEAKEVMRVQQEQLDAQAAVISALTEDIEKSSRRWWPRLRGFLRR